MYVATCKNPSHKGVDHDWSIESISHAEKGDSSVAGSVFRAHTRTDTHTFRGRLKDADWFSETKTLTNALPYITAVLCSERLVFKHPHDAARLLIRDACKRLTGNGARRFQGSFCLGEPLTLWDKNQYWRGIFLLSLRRNQSADAFRDSVKEEPTSVDLALAETLGDVYGYKRRWFSWIRGVKHIWTVVRMLILCTESSGAM